MKFSVIEKQVLSNLIESYKQLLPSPSLLKMPERIPDEKLHILQECIVSALRNGLMDIIKDNVQIMKYEPFLDAVASQIVGKIDVSVQLVVKIGDDRLKDQVQFIQNQKPHFQSLYPTVFSIQESTGVFACVMEYLLGFISLHDMVFKAKANNKWEVSKALDTVFDTLLQVYRSGHTIFSKPNLEKLYIEERIKNRILTLKNRIANGTVNFPDSFAETFPNGIDSLLETSLEYQGKFLEPLNTVLPKIEDAVKNLTPNFSTLVHGDAHPGNIMIKLADPYCEMKFLDPNPYIEKSDYLYDMGKMIHWFDKMGFVILETGLKQKVLEVSTESSGTGSNLKIQYNLKDHIIDDQNQQIFINNINKLRVHAREYSYHKIAGIADVFNDNTWKDRLNLSIACAYFGGLNYFTEPSQLLLIYIEGLKYLNKLVHNL